MRPLVAGVLVTLLAAAGLASGAPLTFSYSARITQVNLDVNDPLVGSFVTGSYTFDSDADDETPGTGQSSYSFAGPPFGMTAFVGGASFATSDFLNITVATGMDGLLAHYAVLALSGDAGLSIDLMLDRSDIPPVAGAPLPLTPPPLALFDVRTVHVIENIDAQQVQIDAELTALAAVPEPATQGLILLGLALLALVSSPARNTAVETNRTVRISFLGHRRAFAAGLAIAVLLVAARDVTAQGSAPVNVWQLRNEPVTATRASALARTLGMNASLLAVDDSVYERVTVTDGASRLDMFRPSGAFRYLNDGFYRLPLSPASIPLPADAVAIAATLLRSIDDLPSGADIETAPTFIENGSGGIVDHAVRVSFTPQVLLRNGSPSTSPQLAPVIGGDVAVWVGDQRRVLAIESLWRPTLRVPAASVIPRAEGAARVTFVAEHPQQSGLPGTLMQELAYVLRGENEPQSFLDPVYVFTMLPPVSIPPGAPGSNARTIVGDEPGTDWSPRVDLLSAYGGVDRAVAVPLRVRIQGGTPPYRFRALSTKQGALLERIVAAPGEIEADLAPTLVEGRHEVFVEVSDANGAQVEGRFPWAVSDSSHAAPVRLAHTPTPAAAAPLFLDFTPFNAEDFATRELAGKPKGDPERVTSTTPEKNLTFAGAKDSLALTPPTLGTVKGGAPRLAIYRRSELNSLLKKQRLGAEAIAFLFFDSFRYQMFFSGVKKPDDARRILTIGSNKCSPGYFHDFGEQRSPFYNDENRLLTRSCDVPDGFAIPAEISPAYLRRFEPTQWPDPDTNARNGTSGAMESYIRIRDLPGTLELRFLYQYGTTMCAPNFQDYKALGAQLTGGATKGFVGGGRCPAFIPEVDWKFTPPADGVACEDLKRYCQANPGKDADGYPFCSWGFITGRETTPVDPATLCAAGQKFPVSKFDIQLFSRVEHTGGAGGRTRPIVLSDDPRASTFKAMRSDGAIDRTIQNKTITTLPGMDVGDFATHILPMAKEREALVAAPGWDFAQRIGVRTDLQVVQLDNLHQKSVAWQVLTAAQLQRIKDTLGAKWRVEATDPVFVKFRDYVAYPGGNALNDKWDEEPVLHLHERWWVSGTPLESGKSLGPQYNGDEAPAKDGVAKDKNNQHVIYIVVLGNLDRFNERRPNHRPNRLVNGEALNTDPGVKAVFWIESRGSVLETSQCKVACTGKMGPQCCRTHQAPLWWTPRE